MSKSLVRDLICKTLWALGISHPARFSRGRLLVVTFHRVLPDPLRRRYPYPSLVVTPKELDWLCGLFTTHFRCGAFTEIWHQWRNSSSKEKPYLAITFDDGQLDNYEHARPVLAKHGLHATFYVPVQPVDEQRLVWHDRFGFAAQSCAENDELKGQLLTLARTFELLPIDENDIVNSLVEKAKKQSPGDRQSLIEEVEAIAKQPPPSWSAMMSWNQLQQLAAEGHEIGSHSMTHALIPQLSDDQLDNEITESRRLLEKRLSIQICSFCFPNGDNDLRARRVVKRAGYHSAVTTKWGLNEVDTDRYAIKRCDIDAYRLLDRRGHLSAARLFFRLSGLRPGLR